VFDIACGKKVAVNLIEAGLVVAAVIKDVMGRDEK
jgi:hypothetical protein